VYQGPGIKCDAAHSWQQSCGPHEYFGSSRGGGGLGGSIGRLSAVAAINVDSSGLSELTDTASLGEPASPFKDSLLSNLGKWVKSCGSTHVGEDPKPSAMGSRVDVSTARQLEVLLQEV
jgi:hypothetical protein